MAKPPKVVVDTNVWISGILFGGKPERIIQLIEQGELRSIISLPILEEISDILARKFNLPRKDLEKLLGRVIAISEIIETKKTFVKSLRDPKDNPIVETALAGRCAWIITGDKDLLVLEQFQNIPIVNPDQFLLKYRGS